MPIQKTFGKYMEKFPEKIRKLAVSIRILILKIIPRAQEVVHPGMKWITYGIPRSIIAIKPKENEVQVHFFEGVQFNDPKCVLKGSGSRLRYISVLDLRTSKKSLEKFITQAYDVQKKKKFKRTTF
jgi:hypothetical protein